MVSVSRGFPTAVTHSEMQDMATAAYPIDRIRVLMLAGFNPPCAPVGAEEVLSDLCNQWNGEPWKPTAHWLANELRVRLGLEAVAVFLAPT